MTRHATVTLPLDLQAGHTPCVLPLLQNITEEEMKAFSCVNAIKTVVIRITIPDQNLYLVTFRLIMLYNNLVYNL